MPFYLKRLREIGVSRHLLLAVDRLHALGAGPWDLVLLTGDLTNAGQRKEYAQLTQNLGRLRGGTENRLSLLKAPRQQ